ncbi:MAG: cysteine synthase A [Pseudomonadota bacterium]
MSEEQPDQPAENPVPETPSEAPVEPPAEAPVESPPEAPADTPPPAEEPAQPENPAEGATEENASPPPPAPEGPDPDRELSPDEDDAAKKQADDVAKNEALQAPKDDSKPVEKEEDKRAAKDTVAAAGPIVEEAGSRGKIYESVLHAIGNTPLVKLPRLKAKHGLPAELLAKLEFCNPTHSLKDREAFAIITDAEKAGKIKTEESILVEASSGNMAVSMALVAAAKGYKIVLVMPESVSFERRRLLQLLGADLELAPADGGMKAAIERIPAILKQRENAVHLDQFTHMACAQIHEETTGPEIWADTEGNIDALVVGVGSGATLTGVTKYLKAQKSDIRVFAVEPAGSAVLSGKAPGGHKIQGLGAGFVPEILDASLIDHVVQIADDQCYNMAKQLIASEGIPAGIASGAVMAAAVEVAKLPDFNGKNVVAILSSGVERYVGSKLYEDR